VDCPRASAKRWMSSAAALRCGVRSRCSCAGCPLRHAPSVGSAGSEEQARRAARRRRDTGAVPQGRARRAACCSRVRLRPTSKRAPVPHPAAASPSSEAMTCTEAAAAVLGACVVGAAALWVQVALRVLLTRPPDAAARARSARRRRRLPSCAQHGSFCCAAVRAATMHLDDPSDPLGPPSALRHRRPRSAPARRSSSGRTNAAWPTCVPHFRRSTWLGPRARM
jgi:hypothetical protein